MSRKLRNKLPPRSGQPQLSLVEADLVKSTVANTLAIMGYLPQGTTVTSVSGAKLQERIFGMDPGQASQFGPGVPPPNTPLATTPDPRVFDYQTGWNYASQPGTGRALDYQTMRDLANVYDLLRKGIEIRKDEIASLKLQIVARTPDKKKAKAVIAEQRDRIEELEDFFAYPDRRHSWQAWIRCLLEEYFVTDAVTLWKWKDYGGRPVGYKPLDGTLIKPLLDINGNAPLPPNPAYQQYVKGVPRWLFTSDELMWCPKNVRVNTPYGFSPVEQFVLHINGALRFERWSVDYFTDGTIPEGVAEAPASWTKVQIQEFNQYWDTMMAGDTRALRKLKFVAAGFKFHQLKPFEFNMEFAHWLISMTASCVDVTVQELGFEPMHGGIGGKGYGEEQSSVLRRKSTKPTLKWLRDVILNPIIWHDFGYTDLAATFSEEIDESDESAKMAARDLAIRNGSVSIDQVVEEDGGEPVGIGRVFVFGNQVLGEPDLIRLSRDGVGAVAPMGGDSGVGVGSANPVSGGNQSSNVNDQPGASPAVKGAAVKAVPQLAPPKPLPGIDELGSVQTDKYVEEIGSPTEGLPDEYTAKVAAYEEGSKFLRFFRNQRKRGSWKDFESPVIDGDTLALLNAYGAAGSYAEADIRKVLAGVM